MGDLTVELQTISAILLAAGVFCLVVAFVFWIKLGYLGRAIRKIQRFIQDRQQKREKKKKEKRREPESGRKSARSSQRSKNDKLRMTPIQEEIIGLEESDDDTGLLSMVRPEEEYDKTEDINEEDDEDGFTEETDDITETLDKQEESTPHFTIKKKVIIAEADHMEI